MASADLREELTCSICLSIFTDPVTLICGHDFCLGCIKKTLDNQTKGEYSCPECRKEFKKIPELKRNFRLSNIVACFHSTQRESGISCTYCVNSSVPAAKSCLHCEASLCDKHVTLHSKSEEHVMSEPTNSWSNRKCSVHKEPLRYYCSKDEVCICVSCFLIGKHKGHQMELLFEACKKKKKKLINVLDIVESKHKDTEKRVCDLQKHSKELCERSAGETKQVIALLREEFEVLEKQILSEISRKEQQVSCHISGQIKQFEMEKDILNKKMCYIKELCNTTDPLTVLQELESPNVDLGEFEKADSEDTQRDDKKAHAENGLDENLIYITLYRRLADFVTDVVVKKWLHLQESLDISLDVNTAANNVALSGDLKTASWSEIKQQRPEKKERFLSHQVLSTRNFSSGRHYWEVQASGSGEWSVGLCYPSIARQGDPSIMGRNKKSWCLQWNNRKHWSFALVFGYNEGFSVVKDSLEIPIHNTSSCQRLGILLDYEAGRLSFYALSDPIQHLYTFTVTFKESLYMAFRVDRGAWVRIRS